MQTSHYLISTVLFVHFITFLPFVSSWSWLWKPRPLHLSKNDVDRCDFEEEEDCELTFFQASDWYRGHEDKVLHWLRAHVSVLPEQWRRPLPVNWVRLNGFQLPAGQSGPRIDHTTTSPFGHFMFLHPQLNNGYHVTVLLQTKEYSTSLPLICLRYNYVLTGEAHALVALIIKDSRDKEVKILQGQCLTTNSHQDGYTWKEAQCSIKVPTKKAFKISIMGNVGDWRLESPEDSIAVDDIEIRTGKCPTNDFLELFHKENHPE